MTASKGEKRVRPPFEIAGELVPAGETRRLDLPVAQLPTQTSLELPIMVVHGRRSGPCVWISGAIHGDELNGVEIIREVLGRVPPKRLRGTLLAVPIVNLFGFVQQSRYLPDGRDLNRSFPGSKKGSLAARLADMFMREVVDRCTHGVDLHTGARERDNLPQIRGDLQDPESRRIAFAFGAPVVLQSNLRAGSLREAARRRGIATVVYEAGEAQRFDARAIRVGVRGVLRVLQELGSLPSKSNDPAGSSCLELSSSSWIRAGRAGILRLDVDLGARTTAKQVLGIIADPFGTSETRILAPGEGVVIGLTRNPVVHRGDAVLHVGQLADQRSS